jgi:hypothetical protein
MKKFFLISILILQVSYIYCQSPGAENTAIEKLNKDQASQLKKKWTAFISKYTYPELKINSTTGEVEISDTLTLKNMEKKIIFQRCLQWIAINYGNLAYSDMETGKIIANGAVDLNHYGEIQAGFGSRENRAETSTASYALILTFKENRLKYTITNITITFRNYSETVDEISFPAASLYPISRQDQLQWLRSVTVLNAAKDKFSVELKNSLINYINAWQDDYKF